MYEFYFYAAWIWELLSTLLDVPIKILGILVLVQVWKLLNGSDRHRWILIRKNRKKRKSLQIKDEIIGCLISGYGQRKQGAWRKSLQSEQFALLGLFSFADESRSPKHSVLCFLPAIWRAVLYYGRQCGFQTVA